MLPLYGRKFKRKHMEIKNVEFCARYDNTKKPHSTIMNLQFTSLSSQEKIDKIAQPKK